MEDRRKPAAGKSGPIDLLKNLTSSASKDKRSGGVTGTSSLAPPSAEVENLDNDRRPLQTFPLSPPDYVIAPEILMESFVEMPVTKLVWNDFCIYIRVELTGVFGCEIEFARQPAVCVLSAFRPVNSMMSYTVYTLLHRWAKITRFGVE